MLRFAALRDAKGRRAFALPRRRSSDDAEWTALDRISMREWLTRSGFSGARLFWFAEYATRDDFGSSLDDTSAWAGIHYFASRLRGASRGRPLRGARRVPDLARGERPPREAPREGRRRPDRDRGRRLRRRPEGRRRHAPLARRAAERGRRGDGPARRLRPPPLHRREGPRPVAREPARLPPLLRVRAVARREPDALRPARPTAASPSAGTTSSTTRAASATSSRRTRRAAATARPS